MVVRQETRPPGDASPQPEVFRAAAASLLAARLRPEVSVEPMPAPQRIAPYATALSADVEVDDEELATGRIILLHDPHGNDAWGGTFRFVSYVRAEVDPSLASDAMLGAVGWSWLTDALGAHEATHSALSGTVTRVSVENFGVMSDEEPSAQVEIRASWTPEVDAEATAADLRDHVEAWGELLCTAVGLEPLPEGVAMIAQRRGQRGS
ncbi:DUF3000 domain-containing protein [Nocardioides alcanivorans]|uniref:DUF3000 domain-containing protein n=1 Tax=Nocardioides alcanivorans TaxID=2897352 RepID=UPI001F47822C|nr:DUF3000 domain-containing protein [Nocardioides alcanivorans]